MSKKDTIEEIRRKARESAEKIFNDKTKEEQDAFEEETVLGRPENLLKDQDDD